MSGKSKTLVLKWLVVSFLGLIVIPFFIPFSFYRNTLNIVSNHLSGYENYKKLKHIENNFYVVTARFDYPIEIIINYGKSFFVSKESLNIKMSLEDYGKLNSRILLAKQRGHINSEDKNIEVNATLVVNNKLLLKSKVRLRGTYLDHAIGDKWSFRIKLKNNKTLYGMNRFSLHNPLTRMWLSEWLYHKALKYSGLMYLEYKFVDLYINGRFRGVYAIEEFMHANLVEKNNRRDGVLLRQHNFLFNQKKIDKNEKLRRIYNEYKIMYDKYKKNEIKVSDFYDVEKLAQHFAITQIFGSGHSHAAGNWITYYNPITKKVEVIGYDSNSGRILTEAKLQIEPGADFYFKNTHVEKIFEDREFVQLYLFYIAKYSQKEYFSKFFDRYQTELLDQINIIRRVKPWQVVNQYKEIIYANQEYITEYLSEYLTDYKNITDSEVLKFMTAHSIESNKYGNLNYDGVELINRNGNIEEVPFVKYDHLAKVARIAKGDYTLTQNLIIPPGITFIIDPGVTLYLDNSSSVISYSNLQLLGNKNSKVKIISVSPANSLIIYNAKNRSKFDNVIFQGLSQNALNEFISGSVTIYESKIDIFDSIFTDNRVLDDHLNIIRSKFKLVNTQITNSNSDGIDIDFSDGFIHNLSISKSNNDGIDFSKSTVQGSKLFISSSTDKGISVGENSKISISDARLEKNKICLAIKDSSYFIGNNLELSEAKYGVALYNKKPMYGFPKGEINNLRFNNIRQDYFLENGSKLRIDNKNFSNYSSGEAKSDF